MRRILLIITTLFLLFALTPIIARAETIPTLQDRFYYSPRILIDDYYDYALYGRNPLGNWYGVDDYYYNDPYAFGYWYGVNNTDYTNNSFGTWTGVNNVPPDYNPFGTWTGVNNIPPDYNPFGVWTGVNNVPGDYDPFGTWTGVNNMDSLDNPFGTWTGVNNTDSLNNPFGVWEGVHNSDTTSNPFGTWTGVNNVNDNGSAYPAQFDSQGYQSNRPQVKSYQSGLEQAEYEYFPGTTRSISTSFVAPKTGTSKSAPIVFAGILTLIMALFLQRRTIINFIRS